MSDVRQPELRESPGRGDIREWLKESFEGAEWEDDDSPVDFDDTPLDQILSVVFDWHDRRLSDALNRLGYSSETIRDFRENRFVLASAVEGLTVPVGCTAIIDPDNRHPAARKIDHMLLIDGFELLRAARSYSAQAKPANMLRCLQLFTRHWSIFHEKERPAILAAKGGRASGEARRKKQDEKLDAAARAHEQLIKKHEYAMRVPKKSEIEKAARLSKDDLRNVSLKKIKARAAELRSKKGSDE
jgi:hypothetical protein